MTLQDLRYIVTLAETKHFARAAAACHVTQPTLSTQIKKLEEDIGVALFERTNKRVMLTPAGHQLVAQARIILEEADKFHQMAQQAHDPMAGPFRLGVIPTLGPYLMPYLVPQLRATYPQLRLYIREDITERLLDLLRAGRLDALLLALPVPDDGLQVRELFREPFVLALPAGDPLTRKSQVRQADLLGAHILLLEDGHCLRDQALAVCGFPTPRGAEDFRATSLETLRQMVAAGVGCTLLPRLASQAPSPSEALIALRPFATPEPHRTIGLVYRQGFPRLETVQAFTALVRAHAPAGVAVIQDDIRPESARRAKTSA
jgi:LysR family transcriptional regulator, hydrogen peroxide-inducible genes activator